MVPKDKSVMESKGVIKDNICYMCGFGCPIKIHIRNGKATRIDIAEPRVDICPRWRAQLNFVYHPDRLKYPLKRVGERGKSSFGRISWEEAPTHLFSIGISRGRLILERAQLLGLMTNGLKGEGLT